MQASQNIPVDIVLVIQALIVLFLAAPPLVRAIFRLPAKEAR
jgi:simple sugar transport system permease protein